MRNDVAADENHHPPELVHLRANAINDVRRRNVMVVGDRDAKAATEEIVALSGRTKLPALHGALRSPAELVMCEANAGEKIVRQMFDAVELVAKQLHVDAVKDSAVKIMTAIRPAPHFGPHRVSAARVRCGSRHMRSCVR